MNCQRSYKRCEKGHQKKLGGRHKSSLSFPNDPLRQPLEDLRTALQIVCTFARNDTAALHEQQMVMKRHAVLLVSSTLSYSKTLNKSITIKYRYSKSKHDLHSETACSWPESLEEPGSLVYQRVFISCGRS